MDNTKSYNDLRSANLDENRRMLEELGVRMPRVGERVMLNKPKLPSKRPKQRISEKIPEPNLEEDDGENKTEDLGRSGARSFRVRLRPKNFQEEGEEYLFDPPKPRLPGIRPNPSYGKIPGVEVGREWATRMECSYDLIHRPTVAGIHGGPDGAYSVALSGGYEDDVDFGESFTYTGEGGRDLKGTKANPKNLRTAPQSKDQSLDRGNLALARSVETQNPVRVVRGYKLDSQYAPEEGYRYDGLYNVKKYWAAVGKSGFKVWKFAFVRSDSEPAPWVQMQSGNLGSPTSPSTPASIPQTGVEACEAPSLDTDDCEDYLQLEEAQIGARQPDDRGRVKKKVHFNSEEYVRIFETESFEEEKPEELGRMTTRSSRTKVVESDDKDDDRMPAQLCKRSQRVVKPTAKVLENLSREDDEKPPPKLVNSSKLSSSPVVVITEIALTSVPNQGGPLTKKKSVEDDNTPKKSSRESNEDVESSKDSFAVSKSPQAEKSSSKSKSKCMPEDKFGERSASPAEKSFDSAILRKSPESALKEKNRKNSFSPDFPSKSERPKSPKSSSDKLPKKRSISPDFPSKSERAKSPKSSSDKLPRKRSISPDFPSKSERPKSPKSSSDKLPRKRSISPDYPSPYEKPKSASDGIPIKRSVSPEYLPEDELQKKRSLGKSKNSSVSPRPSLVGKKEEKRGRPRKLSKSPQLSLAKEEAEKRPRGRPRKSSVSPQSSLADKKAEKRSRGRPRKSSVSPQSSPADDKAEKRSRGRPRKSLESPTLSSADKKPKKSPKSSPQKERTKRSVSPEYPPEDEKPKTLPYLTAQGKSKKRSISPEHQRRKSFPGSPTKKSYKSRNFLSKGSSKKHSLSPNYLSKSLDKQSKSSKSLTEEKLQKKTKSPTINASKKSPKPAGAGPERFKVDNSKNSPNGSLKKSSKDMPDLPRKVKSDNTPTRGSTSPQKNPSPSKKSIAISQNMKSPKTSKVSKTESASVGKSEKSNSLKNSIGGARSSSPDKMRSPEAKSKQAATKESKRSRKRSLSPSDKGPAETKVPVKKKPRVSSPRLSSEKPTKVRKSVQEENDVSKEEESPENELDAPMSPESLEDEAAAECESGDPTHTTLASEPETKKFGKEDSETLTPPETETFNSNSSSPTPTASSSVSSPAGSTSVSQAPVLVKANDKSWNSLDNDEFPSDEEILSMMQISLGACTNDGPRITVKMVDGKWIEMEDTATNPNEATAPR